MSDVRKNVPLLVSSHSFTKNILIKFLSKKGKGSSVHSSVRPSVCPSVRPSVRLFGPSVCLVHPFVCSSIRLFIRLFVWTYVRPSVRLSVLSSFTIDGLTFEKVTHLS